MGVNLTSSDGANVVRQIKVFDITGKTATQIEDAYNTNYGQVGWRIIQVIVMGSKTFIIAEKEG